MAIHDEQRSKIDVVVCESSTAAELVEITLAAHGISAHTTYVRGPFPSVEWAEGYGVTVDEEDIEEARRILSALSGRDDIVTLDG